MTSSNKKRRLTGLQPTGVLHVGNYAGAIRPFLNVESGVEMFLFIADFHALNSVHNAGNLTDYTDELAATLLALGVDPAETVLFRQSDVPEVAELTWILSCVTGHGLLERAHSFKDAVAKGREINAGLFIYPVLMAADILLYDSDEVPVGKDQKQHLEMTRDIATRFNYLYGEDVFKIPEPVIKDEVMVVPGLDGQKMSKSYGNTIMIFEKEKDLKKKIMAIATDSTPMEAPKKVEGTLIHEFYKLFATEAQRADFVKRLGAGGMGWGHAKEELFVLIRDHFAPFREKYEGYRADRAALNKVLLGGAVRARDLARAKLARVRQVVGFSH